MLKITLKQNLNTFFLKKKQWKTYTQKNQEFLKKT